MPAEMIHLLCAHQLRPAAPDLYWLGSIAPDTVHERAEKDRLHLRTAPDREAALRQLGARLDLGEPFSLGWLLHLYADLRWDTLAIPAYRAQDGGEGWFSRYRSESHRASFALCHSLAWSRAVFDQMERAELGAVPAFPPFPPAALAEFRDKVIRKHRERLLDEPEQAEGFFRLDYLRRFAADTAVAFTGWLP